MRAMILAAGFGTRLFPLTVDRTKPAIPFLGKPLVGYVAEYLSGFGFNEIAVNLHHQPESVKAALGDGSDFGVSIHYALEQPAILGTAGALWNARDFLQDETFLVINGKIVTDIDLAAAFALHKDSGALATMVLKENPRHEKFTIIETENGFVKNFGGFPEPVFADEVQSSRFKAQSPLMFTGIQILESEVFDYIPPNQESDIISVFYRPAIAHGEKIAAYIADGYWYELSTIPRYLDISLAVLNGANDGISIGKRGDIALTAQVKDSILWDDVMIENAATIERAILGDGVRIRAGETVKNAAVVRADLVKNVSIPPKAMAGHFAGDNYVVPLG